MVNYPSNPQFRIITTYGGTNYTFTNEGGVNGQIIRKENDIDIAIITFDDYLSRNLLSKMDKGSAITIDFKDATETSWTTVFSGVIRQLDTPFSRAGEFLQLTCDGAGYPLAEMLVADDYGLQSSYTTSGDSIYEIIRNAIIPGWVNKVLGNVANSSGYAITVTSGGNEYIEDIAAQIQYVYFPYKPANKCIQDLCDLVQALQGTNAGPHWIVTTDSKLFLSTIGAHHVGVSGTWPNYYGGTQTTATLAQDKDFQEYNFQRLTKEANVIVYYGQWRKPSNGDIWTEANATNWNKSANAHLEDANDYYMVGAKSLRVHSHGPTADDWEWPSSLNANWNFTAMSTPQRIPTLNFYAMKGADIPFVVYLKTDATNYYYYNLQPDLTTNVWSHFRLPVGPYWGQFSERKEDFHWLINNTPNWNAIDYIMFSATFGVADTQYVWIDGLHFGGVPVIRVAREKYPGAEGGTLGQAGNEVKIKLIVDNVGKDDSYIASDDSGAIAQIAKAELLRAQTTPTVGTITTPLIKDLLPGETLHLHAKKKSDSTFNIDANFRVLQLTHTFGSSMGNMTMTNVTSDVINANARRAFTDTNLILQSIRPSFQDRQASSIKAGEIDADVPMLEKYY